MPSCRPLIVALVVALAAVSGCRKSREPSPAYAEAQRRHVALLEARGLEGYGDAEAGAILQLLGQVPPDSSDAEAAASLKGRIEAEQARLRAGQAEVDAALAFARTPGQVPPSAEAPAPAPAEPPPAEAPDAGTPQPTLGMPASELAARFSRCFQQEDPVYAPGKGQREAWGLKDLGICRELHPTFVKTLLIVEDGKVSAFGERGPRIYLLPDGGTQPVP